VFVRKSGRTDVDSLILFDTDVLIDAGLGVPEAVQALQEAEQRGGLAVSVVTQMELIIGCRNTAELKALERFLRRFRVLPLTEDSSGRAVELLRQYRLSHGLMIADALIAATALMEDLPLVSKNQRHFRFISGLQLLPYPNPFSAVT
jgi:predicted nucleic acid-binding protein